MKRRFATATRLLGLTIGFLALAMAAQLVRAQDTGGVVWVDGVTDLFFQNVDPQFNANVMVDFYPVAGAPNPANPPPPFTEMVPNILQPGETFGFFSPHPRLGNLAQYAVIARSNRHTAGVNRTREPITGAAVMYNNVQVSPSIIVPLVTLAFTSPTDVTSIVSVQSTEKNPPLPINGTLYSKTYFQGLVNNGTLFQYQERKNSPIQIQESVRDTGGTWLVDLTDPRFATPIAAEVTPTPPPGMVPVRLYGSTGWMRFSPATAPPPLPGTPPPTAPRQVGAESFLNLRRVNTAVSGFAGVPEEHKARQLFMPLFRANFAGITGYAIVNPGPRDVRIRATYYGSPQAPNANCRDKTFIHYGNDGADTIPIAANDNVVLYHLPGDPPPIAPGSVGNPKLPDGCFGSAVVEIVGGDPTDGIVAMVNDFAVDGTGIPRTADAYMPTRLIDANARVAVPMLEHDARVPAGQSLPAKHSSLQVMNVDPSGRTAQVSVTFFPSPGQPVTVNASIPPNRAHTFWTGAVPGISAMTNFSGSAIVQGDAKLAVVVTVAEFSRDSTAYSGVGQPTSTPMP